MRSGFLKCDYPQLVDHDLPAPHDEVQPLHLPSQHTQVSRRVSVDQQEVGQRPSATTPSSPARPNNAALTTVAERSTSSAGSTSAGSNSYLLWALWVSQSTSVPKPTRTPAATAVASQLSVDKWLAATADPTSARRCWTGSASLRTASP